LLIPGEPPGQEREKKNEKWFHPNLVPEILCRYLADFLHRAMGGKGVAKIVFGCVEGRISNEQFIITHVL
jgi:hypothetical protein